MSNIHIERKPWYKRIPHAVTMLFGIIILVTVLTHILPAGTYERILIDGRKIVVPNSYTTIESTPIGILNMFRAIPLDLNLLPKLFLLYSQELSCLALWNNQKQ